MINLSERIQEYKICKNIENMVLGDLWVEKNKITLSVAQDIAEYMLLCYEVDPDIIQLVIDKSSGLI